ncbi:hypothetical protein [Nostoc sp.]
MLSHRWLVVAKQAHRAERSPSLPPKKAPAAVSCALYTEMVDIINAVI